MSARLDIFQIHDVLAAFTNMLAEERVFTHAASRVAFPVAEMKRYTIAAVGLAMQVAIEAGHDVETIRAIERKTIQYIEKIP